MDSRPDASFESSTERPLAPAPTAGDAEHALRALTDRLSHQLRGMVNSIEGYTDLLGARLATPEQRELSQRILESTAQIEQMVRHLRCFSAPVRPVYQAVPIRRILDGLQHAVGTEPWQRVEVQGGTETDGDSTLLADPILLRQALQALTQNALDATSTRSIRLTVSTVPEARQMQFAVWNPGVIAVGQPRKAVFTPFFSTKERRLGMGLPLARRIAEAHGGTVELAESAEQSGTRFVLSVPHPRDDGPEALVLHPRS